MARCAEAHPTSSLATATNGRSVAGRGASPPGALKASVRRAGTSSTAHRRSP